MADTFLVFAGDGLYQADFAAILAQHWGQNAELTLGVAAVHDGSRYGVVSTDSRGCVTEMREKPPGAGPVQTVSCGVYVVSQKALDRFKAIPPPIDWIDIVPTLLAEGAVVATARIQSWRDIGMPSDLLNANIALLATGEISHVAEKSDFSGGTVWTQGGQYGDLSTVTFEANVLLGANVDIGQRTSIRNSVIGHGVQIGSGGVISDSLILPGGQVPPDSTLVSTIAG
jgi:glucose-1-phosphate adenylyltransferase